MAAQAAQQPGSGATGGFPSGTMHPGAVDTVVDPHFLPDPIVVLVQWIFQQEPWVMWGGVALGGLMALLIGWQLWLRREALLGWFRGTSSGLRFGLGLGAFVALVVSALGGWKANDFMMNDKRFCQGCHIFVPDAATAEKPDSGYYTVVNALKGKHDTLGCHSCHEMHMGKEAVKMVFWMSGHREEEIPAHGKVPRRICESCHVQGEASKAWQEIARTAGHRVHLESDSAALREVECLSCHARSAHKFQPADSTCSQKGCHLTDEIGIRLGKMSQAQGLHCNACHQFTKVLPQMAGFDSAQGALRPGQRQCFSCHEMRERLATFNPSNDPHKGQCGMCHNPHDQVKPVDALKTCATNGCHIDWKKVEFHVGKAHARIGANCAACHDEHAARVDASDCTGCHESVRGSATGKALRTPPPLPFDTTKAKGNAKVSALPEVLSPDPPRRRGQGDGPPADAMATPANAGGVRAKPAAPPDSFAHDQHRKVACVSCHPTSSRTSILTFERPRGCQICHHEAPQQRDCATCHAEAELRGLVHRSEMTVKVAKAEARPVTRTVPFRHDQHTTNRCLECHQEPVTLKPTLAARTCTDCHADHHAGGRDCATCHRTEGIVKAHQRPVDAHVQCSSCHASATVGRLAPTRSFCLTCHDPAKADHHAPAECTTCHMLRAPEAYQPLLRGTWRESGR
ncbi:MAG: hypothetical protein NW201_04260 [Gemmatimonadales bacterium]|nr:hypothetical protein [Gemmatimonadales bacterium]